MGASTPSSPDFCLPKTEARANRAVRGLLEEAAFGLPFLGSRLLQELLSGKEGRKAEALVLARLRKDPYLATTVLPLPLPRVEGGGGGGSEGGPEGAPLPGASSGVRAWGAKAPSGRGGR